MNEIESFRNQVIRFIKWVNKDDKEIDITPDLKEVRKAKTLKEIETVLARHDSDGMFLSFIQ